MRRGSNEIIHLARPLIILIFGPLFYRDICGTIHAFLRAVNFHHTKYAIHHNGFVGAVSLLLIGDSIDRYITMDWCTSIGVKPDGSSTTARDTLWADGNIKYGGNRKNFPAYMCFCLRTNDTLAFLHTFGSNPTGPYHGGLSSRTANNDPYIDTPPRVAKAMELYYRDYPAPDRIIYQSAVWDLSYLYETNDHGQLETPYGALWNKTLANFEYNVNQRVDEIINLSKTLISNITNVPKVTDVGLRTAIKNPQLGQIMIEAMNEIIIKIAKTRNLTLYDLNNDAWAFFNWDYSKYERMFRDPIHPRPEIAAIAAEKLLSRRYTSFLEYRGPQSDDIPKPWFGVGPRPYRTQEVSLLKERDENDPQFNAADTIRAVHPVTFTNFAGTQDNSSSNSSSSSSSNDLIMGTARDRTYFVTRSPSVDIFALGASTAGGHKQRRRTQAQAEIQIQTEVGNDVTDTDTDTDTFPLRMRRELSETSTDIAIADAVTAATSTATAAVIAKITSGGEVGSYSSSSEQNACGEYAFCRHGHVSQHFLSLAHLGEGDIYHISGEELDKIPLASPVPSIFTRRWQGTLNTTAGNRYVILDGFCRKFPPGEGVLKAWSINYNDIVQQIDDFSYSSVLKNCNAVPNIYEDFSLVRPELEKAVWVVINGTRHMVWNGAAFNNHGWSFDAVVVILDPEDLRRMPEGPVIT